MSTEIQEEKQVFVEIIDTLNYDGKKVGVCCRPDEPNNKLVVALDAVILTGRCQFGILLDKFNDSELVKYPIKRIGAKRLPSVTNLLTIKGFIRLIDEAKNMPVAKAKDLKDWVIRSIADGITTVSDSSHIVGDSTHIDIKADGVIEAIGNQQEISDDIEEAKSKQYDAIIIDQIGYIMVHDIILYAFKGNDMIIFLANDVEAELGLTNIRMTIKSYGPQDRCKVSIRSTLEPVIWPYRVIMNGLTELGLYNVLIKTDSKKAEFFNIHTRVHLRDLNHKGTIRLNKESREALYGVFSTTKPLRPAPNKDAIEATEEKIVRSNIVKSSKPTVIPNRFANNRLIPEALGNIEDYDNKSCLYFIQLNDKDYKYGYTDHLRDRLTAHQAQFSKYPECIMFEVKMIIVRDYLYDHVMRGIELSLRSSTKMNGIRIKKIGKSHEIITTDDISSFIEKIVDLIDNAIAYDNAKHEPVRRAFEHKEKMADKQIMMMDRQIEIAKISSQKPIEILKLEIELEMHKVKQAYELEMMKLRLAYTNKALSPTGDSMLLPAPIYSSTSMEKQSTNTIDKQADSGIKYANPKTWIDSIIESIRNL